MKRNYHSHSNLPDPVSIDGYRDSLRLCALADQLLSGCDKLLSGCIRDENFRNNAVNIAFLEPFLLLRCSVRGFACMELCRGASWRQNPVVRKIGQRKLSRYPLRFGTSHASRIHSPPWRRSVKHLSAPACPDHAAPSPLGFPASTNRRLRSRGSCSKKLCAACTRGHNGGVVLSRVRPRRHLFEE